jgi:hypothetical protein
MNHLLNLKSLRLLTLALACFALVPGAQAVNPPPDGDYPGGNTAEGFNALFNLSPQDGSFNTAVGFYSLFSNTTGSFNTAVGAGALDLNTGHNNTATGAAALLLNDIGSSNTATGFAALVSNVDGDGNTAVGAAALLRNTGGLGINTAVGAGALQENVRGPGNTAVGAGALRNMPGSNSESSGNTAVGAGAMKDATGDPVTYNTAIGTEALRNTSGMFNTAIGGSALGKITAGNSNVAVGSGAGLNLDTGDNNIYIGTEAGPTPHPSPIGADASPTPTPTPVAESGTIRIGKTGTHTDTYIAGIYGTPPGANTLPVVCADNGKLTANASSRRFKHDIKQMDSASEAILALKPVSFRYNNDSTNTPWFGLIAEDVAEVNPDLIARDKEGKPFGVRYDQVNVMLLNEFLKEHQKVEDLRKDFQATVSRQQKQIEALTAGLQKVSAQLETSKPATQMVENNR